MDLIPLIFYVAVVFLTLWLADLYLTFRCVKKIGNDIELNPIVRFFMGFRGSHLWIFKTVEIIVFIALVYYVALQRGPYMLSILYGLIFVYALIVAQGLNIYNKVFASVRPAIILFVLLTLFTLFFINLNYSLFAHSVELSSALGECNSEYVDAYSECKGGVPEKQFGLDQYDLDLVIPGV